MRNRKYYSGVRYTKKNTSATAAVVLGIVCAVLVGVIIWAVAVFSNSNEGAFKNQSRQISELKTENEMLKTDKEEMQKEIEELKEEIQRYKEEMKKTPEPEKTPEATKTPSATKTPQQTPKKTANPTSSPETNKAQNGENVLPE